MTDVDDFSKYMAKLQIYQLAELADLNHLDLYHWFKSGFKSIVFFL